MDYNNDQIESMYYKKCIDNILQKKGKPNINHIIQGGFNQYEKKYVELLLLDPVFDKQDEINKLVFDSCYKYFAEKAKWDKKTGTCEAINNMRVGFINNLQMHKGKAVSLAYQSHTHYWLKHLCEHLLPVIPENDKNRIDILTGIGIKINEEIEKKYLNIENI